MPNRGLSPFEVDALRRQSAYLWDDKDPILRQALGVVHQKPQMQPPRPMTLAEMKEKLVELMRRPIQNEIQISRLRRLIAMRTQASKARKTMNEEYYKRQEALLAQKDKKTKKNMRNLKRLKYIETRNGDTSLQGKEGLRCWQKWVKLVLPINFSI